MQRLAIINYGSGNLHSAAKAFERAARETGETILVTSDPEEIAAAERIVLPGQGAMRDCMRSLRESGVRDALLRAAASKPLMGVCVGEQMLFDWSAEGDTKGLGLLPGKVVRFDLEGQLQDDGSRFKVPQMGWNVVRQAQPHPLWDGVADNAFFYFVHSYYVAPDNAAHTSGETVYGVPFTSAVARDNIFATQFHPEKSQKLGLALIANFLKWTP